MSQHGDLGTPSVGTFQAAGEASPVGEDHQREMLPVEVPNSLGRFKSRIWKPDLPSLLDYLQKMASSSAETSAGASRHTTLAGWWHMCAKTGRKRTDQAPLISPVFKENQDMPKDYAKLFPCSPLQPPPDCRWAGLRSPHAPSPLSPGWQGPQVSSPPQCGSQQR